MQAALPPSSRRTRRFPARAFIFQPISGEPVNESRRNRSSSMSLSATSRAVGITLSAPSGRPASVMISATFNMISGSAEGGFRTMLQPAAIAGATLCAARFNGKLKGLIPSTGPTGKRRVMPRRPLLDGARSSGIVSPIIRSASSAARRKVSAPRSISARASRIGFPASAERSAASSSLRALIPEAVLRRISDRSHAPSARIRSNPTCAPITARSICSGLARKVLPTTRPSNGERISCGCGDSSQEPATKIFCGFMLEV